jgi:hypothetical protein
VESQDDNSTFWREVESSCVPALFIKLGKLIFIFIIFQVAIICVRLELRHGLEVNGAVFPVVEHVTLDVFRVKVWFKEVG